MTTILNRIALCVAKSKVCCSGILYKIVEVFSVCHIEKMIDLILGNTYVILAARGSETSKVRLVNAIHFRAAVDSVISVYRSAYQRLVKACNNLGKLLYGFDERYSGIPHNLAGILTINRGKVRSVKSRVITIGILGNYVGKLAHRLRADNIHEVAVIEGTCNKRIYLEVIIVLIKLIKSGIIRKSLRSNLYLIACHGSLKNRGMVGFEYNLLKIIAMIEGMVSNVTKRLRKNHCLKELVTKCRAILDPVGSFSYLKLSVLFSCRIVKKHITNRCYGIKNTVLYHHVIKLNVGGLLAVYGSIEALKAFASLKNAGIDNFKILENLKLYNSSITKSSVADILELGSYESGKI